MCFYTSVYRVKICWRYLTLENTQGFVVIHFWILFDDLEFLMHHLDFFSYSASIIWCCLICAGIWLWDSLPFWHEASFHETFFLPWNVIYLHLWDDFSLHVATLHHWDEASLLQHVAFHNFWSMRTHQHIQELYW